MKEIRIDERGEEKDKREFFKKHYCFQLKVFVLLIMWYVVIFKNLEDVY